jgi:hypothetical protein
MSNRVRASCAAARLLHMANEWTEWRGGEGAALGCTTPSGLRFFRNTITVLNLPEVSGRSTHGQETLLQQLNGIALTIRLNSEGNQNKNGYKNRVITMGPKW